MNYGLKPLPRDSRDIQLGTIFALPRDIPDEFVLPQLSIRNQDTYTNNSDYCTSYAAAVASEYQEGEELLAEPTFAYSKQGDEESWGQTLRDISKAAQKFGNVKKADFDLTTLDKTRLRYYATYPPEIAKLAQKQRKKAYVRVGSFDEIKKTLWTEKRAVIMGILWGWNIGDYELKNIPTTGFGHAVCATGYEGDWLIIQNSYGKGAGKDGMHKVHRDVVDNFVNRFGAYCFIDLSPEEAKELYKRALFTKASLLGKLWLWLKDKLLRTWR